MIHEHKKVKRSILRALSNLRDAVMQKISDRSDDVGGPFNIQVSVTNTINCFIVYHEGTFSCMNGQDGAVGLKQEISEDHCNSLQASLF